MVMLEGFSWESYMKNKWGYTKWRNLLEQADEICDYFDMVWLPPACRSGDGMGYWPWEVNNLNGEWGSKEELIELIKAFHDRGTKAIADVNLTHKKATPNKFWFPEHTETGGDYEFDSKCFDGAIEHSNGTGCELYKHGNYTVKHFLHDYIMDLTKEVGFDGVRIDIAKALDPSDGRYILDGADYIIHEYFDTNYELLKQYCDYYPDVNKNKIFNFNMKYELLNRGIAQGDFTKLHFYGRPGGLMDSVLEPRLINFVDNHDTQGNAHSFVDISDTNKVLLGNAYILMLPADCCIFWQHWVECKDEIKKLLEIRKAYGIDNHAKLQIVSVSKDVYIHQITTKKGRLQLIMYTQPRPELKFADGIKLLYVGKYFAIVGEMGVKFSDKKYELPTYENKDITITFKENEWMNMYFWDDTMKWPGKKLEFDDNHKCVMKFENVPYVEFTLNNGDTIYPQSYPNRRVTEDTTI